MGYGREWGQHYQEPLWAAVGGGQESDAERRYRDIVTDDVILMGRAERGFQMTVVI